MRSFAFPFVASVVVIACSSSSNGGGGADASSFADEYCSLLVPCCGGPREDGSQPGSGCRDVQSFAILTGASYDVTAGTACLSEIRAHKDEADFCGHVSTVTPSCKKVYVRPAGTKAPGEECSRDSDCAASPGGEAQCTPNGFDAKPDFICQVQKDGKAGDAPCIGTRTGQITSGSGASGPKPAEGFLCDTANGVYCAKSGACAPQKDVGEACDSFESSSCKTGSTCSFSTDKCEPQPPMGDTDTSRDPSLFLVCATSGK